MMLNDQQVSTQCRHSPPAVQDEHGQHSVCMVQDPLQVAGMPGQFLASTACMKKCMVGQIMSAQR
jgi:hypothetical protein